MKDKQKSLKKAGWKVSDAKEFLNLSDEEIRLIDTKRALVKLLKEVREFNSVTQEKLAEMISSSQSRIAKLEAGNSDVSFELILKALFALGVPQSKLAKVIGSVTGAV
jgi:DNA-binding XRE family transcriptional regulator